MSKETPDIRDAALLYTRIRSDYAPQVGVLATDSPRVSALKRILARLDPADRAIYTLYVDIGSLRKLAHLLGVSRGSTAKEVTRIRKEILRQYEHFC